MAAPETAVAVDAAGSTPLHLAATKGCTAAVELLLAAAPETATVPAGFRQKLSAHLAAEGGHTAVLQQLLLAAPHTAMAVDAQGSTPLHLAAAGGHALAAVLLLAAAPGTATASNSRGRLPLHCWQQAIQRQHANTARCLGPAAEVLQALLRHGQGALPLFADFVVARLPLSAAEWALLPRHCPGLVRALPSALAHSASQASSLVRHLPAADVARLRTFALCLARVQRRWGIQIPIVILNYLLSHFDAPISP